MKANSTKPTKPGEAIDRHIVYGYVERHPRKGKPPRWYVGVTNNAEKRNKDHVRADTKYDNGYLHRWIQKHYKKEPGRKREAIFKEILEYHELQVIHGTSREAEYLELKWTEQKNALRPHEFNLKAGGYFSEETREKHRAALNRPDVRLRNLLGSAGEEST